MKLTAFTADFQSSQNYLLEFLLLDTADLLLQSSYRLSCLTVKNHVVEKTGLGIYASRNVCVKDITSRASMVLQNY